MVYLACVVYCDRCGSFCPIRYLKSGDVFDCEQVLPNEQRPLAFVCRVCGSLSEHLTIHKAKLRRMDQELPASTIYRMTFQCAEEGCGLPIQIYTDAPENEAKSEIQAWLLPLNLKRACPNPNHAPTQLNAQTFSGLITPVN